MSGRRIRAGNALSGLAAFLPGLPFLLASCVSLEPVKSCSTEIPDPTEDIAGCLVDLDDNPLAGITVYLTPASDAAAKEAASADPISEGPIDTVITSKMGRYSFSGLEDGFYFVTVNDSDRALVEVRQAENSFTQRSLKVDTLKTAGALEVTVFSAIDKQPIELVNCDIPGKPILARTDENGKVELQLPPGKSYDLRCVIGDGFEVVKKSGIAIQSGVVHRDTFYMSSKHGSKSRPPSPASASARYDSITGIVHLTWSKVNYPGFKYWIYRVDPTLQNLYAENTTTDTQYADVVYWPPSETGPVIAKSKWLVYNIGTVLTSSSYTLSLDPVQLRVEVTPPVFLGPSVSLSFPGGKGGCTVGDTARLAGAFSNRYRSNRSLAWTDAISGDTLQAAREYRDSAGTDTLVYPCRAPRSLRVRFTVIDESGLSASAFLPFEVKEP